LPLTFDGNCAFGVAADASQPPASQPLSNYLDEVENMNLHHLPDDAKCPFCGKGSLAFVRKRRIQGDIYRCTAEPPCRGLSFHYRSAGSGCGVSAETAGGRFLTWSPCAHRERAAQDELEEHLTTMQAAARLRVSKKAVIGLVCSGKLPGRKIGVRWLIPAAALRQYNKTAMVTHRAVRA
jgi:excisionase family DNA binding protein